MKLITWNIQWALGMDGIMDPARVVRHAREMADFDVLCLQEVSDNFPELQANDGADQFAAFADLLPGYTAVDGVALDILGPGGRRKRFGNMLLSRYPVAQIIRYTLPWEADVTRNMPRILIEAVVLAPFGPVRVMTTHLEYSSRSCARLKFRASARRTARPAPARRRRARTGRGPMHACRARAPRSSPGTST
jgi:endonuclease/exonuclease/phosphatase family metal-dependent hydrolase